MKQIYSINTKEEFEQEVKENTNVLRAIRLKCYDCSCYQSNEVRECLVTTCPLYPFRLGKNPFLRKELTEDEKREIKERLHRNNTTDKN